MSRTTFSELQAKYGTAGLKHLLKYYYMNTQNKTFNPNKPVQTRDGRKARIICTDVKGMQPIIALLTNINETESVAFYNSDGSFYKNKCKDDLINIPDKHTIERWLCIFSDGSVGLQKDKPKYYNLVACKKLTIEYTEGEGLE